MALIRTCYFIAVFCLSPLLNCFSQTIYYPLNSSQLLKATVADMAMLFQKSVSGSHLDIQVYTSIPSTGIVLVYDSTILDNQSCVVLGNGTNRLQFSASEDNGLIFGIYQYLQELGFKFYQPGSIWEIIPTNEAIFRSVNKIYTVNFKYKSWFISGGHRNWIMDKATDFNWEVYSGDNGHNWSLYQRRNGMLGGYRFAGHRSDIVNGNYLNTIQNNPCYVASFDGSRQAYSASVPDINNVEATQLWANTIEQKYTTYQNNIFSNKTTYVNLFRNFNYNNQYIGIEVPDGARWGNSTSITPVCANINYVTPSDQNVLLANQTVEKIKSKYPQKRFQIYAYAGHANVPSPQLSINSSIDVQVVPDAFQIETSSKGLLNRWYKKYASVSEYHYLNIPQWTGETPSIYLRETKQTIQRLKDKNSQGIIWEASPAKFTSLPVLRAANESLINGKSMDSSLNDFCKNMFGNASASIYTLLQQWSSDEAITMGYFFKDNKFKIPLYIKMVNAAAKQAGTTDTIVVKRLGELKAYLHYLVLYYDLIYDYRSYEEKADKAAALCLYLAKINKLQLVNSYYLIYGIVARYPATSNFYNNYNVFTGSAYLNGNLPLITDEEISTNFQQDLLLISSVIENYDLRDEVQTSEKIAGSNFTPAGKINVNLGYTNGAEYSNKSVFNIYSKSKGSFTIQYTPQFENLGKGFINFTVENQNKGLEIIKDFTIDGTSGNGILKVDLPEAGFYTLHVISKYQSSVKLEILTNGNAFYKNTAFTHRYAEKYTSDMSSLPGYFYVPTGIQKVYFSVNNSYVANKGFLSASEVSNQFLFNDCDGNRVAPVISGTNEPTLFYLEIPADKTGKFWQISNMGQYFICFANISNILWFGNKKGCAASEFTVSVIKSADECITKLTAVNNTNNLNWQVYDKGTVTNYSNTKEVSLPNTTSPNAVITLFSSESCSTVKKLSETKNYYQLREACASGAPIIPSKLQPLLFPNPTSGIVKINSGAQIITVKRIGIRDDSGRIVASFEDKSQIDISKLPSGFYYYLLEVNNKFYTGKIIKN